MTRCTEAVAINGTVESGFEPVGEAFRRNFAMHGEVGAAVAIYVNGALKVDMWGGIADRQSGRAWRRETMALVYSATKGATAVLSHLLAERGELDLDAPVASYWPEFGSAGKGGVTVRMVLAHQAGLPLIEQGFARYALFDVGLVARQLASQRPLWPPGTGHGYHALTYGWLMGEIVFRATGRPLGELFAEEIARPLDLDFFIGLPTSAEPRVAKLVDPPPPSDRAVLEAISDPDVRALALEQASAASDPQSLFSRVLSSNGSLPTPSATAWNDRRVLEREQPAVNGIADARSLARLYAACVSEIDSERLVSDATIVDATREQASGRDRVLISTTRFATGFQLQTPTVPMLSGASFGHSGAGGALGFADVDARVGFGYVPNQLRVGDVLTGDPRTRGLLEALRQVIGD